MSDLQQYIDSLPKNAEGDCEGLYGFTREVPAIDFNREILEPGKHPNMPDGAVGIRVDDDFWLVATLPYRFIDLDIRSIVKTLWPQVYDEAEFGPDKAA